MSSKADTVKHSVKQDYWF